MLIVCPPLGAVWMMVTCYWCVASALSLSGGEREREKETREWLRHSLSALHLESTKYDAIILTRRSTRRQQLIYCLLLQATLNIRALLPTIARSISAGGRPVKPVAFRNVSAWACWKRASGWIAFEVEDKSTDGLRRTRLRRRRPTPPPKADRPIPTPIPFPSRKSRLKVLRYLRLTYIYVMSYYTTTRVWADVYRQYCILLM